MHAIYWLTVSVVGSAPTLLVVDDAHWCDPSSLRALDYLARRLDDVPVCLIVALRPDEPGAALDLLDGLRDVPDVVPLAVGPLGPAAVATLVRRTFRTQATALCDACHAPPAATRCSSGSSCAAVQMAGVAPTPDVVRQVALPSLGDRVLRRAERVSSEAPTLTRAMAVLGDGARLTTAAQLASLPQAHAGEIAHRLRRIGVLATEDPFTFVHPLVRRSVYDAIPDAERQAAHRAAAAAAGTDRRPGRGASHRICLCCRRAGDAAARPRRS